ncbi:hypothetical protein V7S43_003991 [Phytophthora oleae]|uniref:Uncharacterized protein n=1 Tax=Phytophthora oleae TaxID=2107226 RepID=A0ABD3FYR5_9STRA
MARSQALRHDRASSKTVAIENLSGLDEDYVMPANLFTACASPGASDGVLESFLHDMDALDNQQTKDPLVNPTRAVKRRRLDVSAILGEPKKKLPSWLKRKQELESLRQQTQAMETRVAYLEMKKSPATGGLNAFERFKLQFFAFEEKQKCIAAQSENEKLKAQLLLYAKQYEVFQEAMTRAALQENEDVRLPQFGQIKMSCPPVLTRASS